MVKLQKDFTRDMVEHFKNLVQDLETNCSIEPSEAVKEE